MIRVLACLAVFLGAATAAPAQTPLPKVPDGFKIELVLAAPDIEAPTALAVAPNGDVYFAEDPMDMRGPSNKNIDKIYMLKGGDPKKRILVAEELWAVMGMEITGNKLYVVHYPFISVFTLDADGKAVKREDLFTDCGPKSAPPGGFNDHVPSGIRMGMDGWLYVSIGDKGIPRMTKKEKNSGSMHVAEGREKFTKEGNHISLEGGGVIRFRPDGSKLEVFASGTRNHLDVPMDEHDRIFVRDNTDDGDGWNTRFMYITQGGFYGYPWAFTRHPKEVLPMIHDFGGGSPCQGWVYCDDGLPEKYRGRIFHCEWGQGKIWAVKVERDGAGFKYVDQIAFVDPSGTGVKDFRPYSIRPMADGTGFYITDWGFSGWSQKVKAGRIYKVSYVKGDVRPAPRGKDSDSTEKLVKALDHPAHSERLRAQRALIALGEKATPVVIEALRKGTISGAGKRHAVWILGEIGTEPTIEAVSLGTGDPDAGVRAQAARVLGSNPKYANVFTIKILNALLKDKDPWVRLCTMQAFTGNKEPLVIILLGQEPDVFVRFALARWFQHHCRLNDVAKGLDMWRNLEKFPAAQAALMQALAQEYTLDAVDVLKQFLSSPDSFVRKQSVEVLARLYQERKPYAGGWWGTRPEQQKPPAHVVPWEGTPVVRDALLKALADKSAEVRTAAAIGVVNMNDPETLRPLLTQFGREPDAAVQLNIVKAIAGLKNPDGLDFLSVLSLDKMHALAVRSEAILGLGQVNAPKAAAALTRVVFEADNPALRAAALEGLGSLKAKNAFDVCLKSLGDTDAIVREKAVSTLAKLGNPAAVEPLLARLADKEAKVRLATVQALGQLKSAKAVPALLKAYSDPALEFDAAAALAQVPDLRALSIYLAGLQSKNTTLRQACRQALASIRDQAAPILEELAKRNELPGAALAELRQVYVSFAPILAWKLIGPFPNDDKPYPPETELKFDAVYSGAEGKVQWRDRKADAGQHGMVNLLKLYSPNNNVVAYGYAEVVSDSEREAQLLVGSDDTIEIWLNGKKIHERLGDRAWQFDSDKVKAHLQKGKNTLLIKCGQHGGDWAFSVAVAGDASRYAFLKAVPKKLDLETFRDFARKQPGDSLRGAKLFMDLKGLACVKCHAVAGQGGKVGPDLAGIALRYKREDLMSSVLEPSKVIAQGYETHIITTSKGSVVTGVFKGDDGDAVTLMDAEGNTHRIAKKDIDERRISPVSTMPNGLSDGMTLQDFADLIAYLEARREELTPRKEK